MLGGIQAVLRKKSVHESPMTVFAYIFLLENDDQTVSLSEQQRMIADFASNIDLIIDEVVIEKTESIRTPFLTREQGEKVIHRLRPGDVLIALRTEWVLASAGEGGRLIDQLRKKGISLYCVDLGENISLASKRKLIVSEGSSGIIRKLLNALEVCEDNSHGEAIRAVKRARKEQGKYLGGPVPFGWRIDDNGCFRQDREQQGIISEIKALRRDRWSYRDIALKLKENNGIILSHEGIRRILKNDEKRKAQLADT